jgi:hypothetical protein
MRRSHQTAMGFARNKHPPEYLVLPVCVREPRCCRVHDEHAGNACVHVDSCCFPFGVSDEMRARSTLHKAPVCVPSLETSRLSRYRLPILEEAGRGER